jgi:amino acid permease
MSDVHTGLFLGTATALRDGGPVGERLWLVLFHATSTNTYTGLLLGYTVMGSICYSVMVRTDSPV